jgi:hypothetical protein
MPRRLPVHQRFRPIPFGAPQVRLSAPCLQSRGRAETPRPLARSCVVRATTPSPPRTPDSHHPAGRVGSIRQSDCADQRGPAVQPRAARGPPRLIVLARQAMDRKGTQEPVRRRSMQSGRSTEHGQRFGRAVKRSQHQHDLVEHPDLARRTRGRQRLFCHTSIVSHMVR